MLGDYWLNKELAKDRQNELLNLKESYQSVEQTEKFSRFAMISIGLLFALGIII